MMYRRGPKTEPCGNPYGAGTHGDLVGPWTTQRVRSPRNDSSQRRNAPVTPKDIRNRSNNIGARRPQASTGLSFRWTSRAGAYSWVFPVYKLRWDAQME